MIRTIIRIDEVKCNGCGDLAMAARKTLQASGKPLAWQVVTASIDGHIF